MQLDKYITTEPFGIAAPQVSSARGVRPGGQRWLPRMTRVAPHSSVNSDNAQIVEIVWVTPKSFRMP